MNLEKIFEKIDCPNQDLWTRLQEYGNSLALSPEDQEIFTKNEQAAKVYYVNMFFNRTISVGAHLARVKKVKATIEQQRERLHGKLYVEVTDECISGKNSSKYDNEYRKGKVVNNKEYQSIVALINDLSELEANLETAKSANITKGLCLPTLLKLDNQY